MMEGENLELEAHMSRPIYAELASKPTLDNSFYSLAGDELAFYRRHTNIEDEDELKKHILKVQAKAYNVCSQPGPKDTFLKMLLLDLWLPMHPSFFILKVRMGTFSFIPRTRLVKLQIENIAHTGIQRGAYFAIKETRCNLPGYWLLL